MSWAAKIGVVVVTFCGVVVGMSRAEGLRILAPAEAARLYGGQTGIQNKACETQKKCVDQIADDCPHWLVEADCVGKSQDHRTSAGYACTKVAPGSLCSDNAIQQRYCLYTWQCEWKAEFTMCVPAQNYQPNPPQGNAACMTGPMPPPGP